MQLYNTYTLISIKWSIFFDIFLTIPDFPSHIDKTQESWCLGRYIKPRFNLIKPFWTWLIPNPWQIGKFHFNEIELEHECDLNPQFCDSVSIFYSMLTLVSLPDLDHVPEPTLTPVPINLEHEPTILESHIPFMRNECEIYYLIWTPLLNHI